MKTQITRETYEELRDKKVPLGGKLIMDIKYYVVSDDDDATDDSGFIPFTSEEIESLNKAEFPGEAPTPISNYKNNRRNPAVKLAPNATPHARVVLTENQLGVFQRACEGRHGLFLRDNFTQTTSVLAGCIAKKEKISKSAAFKWIKLFKECNLIETAF